jgi:hypothetical protein
MKTNAFNVTSNKLNSERKQITERDISLPGCFSFLSNIKATA